MTLQTAPVIPPRPSRSPRAQGLAAASSEIPKIPPRPSNRRIDRSVSPMRDSYAPSPLNEMPNGLNMSRTASETASFTQRPPSVTIPSLGQEGIEYADLDMGNVSDNQHQVPAETRNISSDLKLHAPRPSLPNSSAKAQVQAVTRTDSQQAAAAGFGKTDDESERRPRSLYSQTGNNSRAESSTTSTSTERRASGQFGDQHGIPEIGQRVPMYPNAGDVQAPSPSPYLGQPAAYESATSLASNSSQRSGRHHYRTRSGRELSLPPGSYGLHGHGVPSNDKFEKAWYDKHPDELFREEQGQYGPGIGASRPDWALTGDELNKIVRSSASKGSGLGTSPAVIGTPEEELGYVATDEYTSRLTSPPPGSHRDSQPSIKSSLREMSRPVSEAGDAGKRESIHSTAGSESGDAGVIHVDDPYHPLHHPDGYAQTPVPEDRSRTPVGDDTEYEEPILAADEVRPDSSFLHPAISPTFDRRGSTDFESRSRTPSAPNSRPPSRPTSFHGLAPNLARHNSRGDDREDSYTPLEDVEEYEPLFPEDSKEKRPLSTADRFKQRPAFSKHRFPSEDIWEDSPNSLQLHAMVTTPDVPKRESTSAFETPEQEAARKQQTEQIDSRKVASHILERGHHHEGAPSRPDTIKQRFPSQDIWEDAPDSHQLVTTIEPHEEEEVKSPPDIPSKPFIPVRPQKHQQQVPPVDVSAKPTLSSSPEKTFSPTEARRVPVIPEKPKPQIPARPAKPLSRRSSDGLTKVTSSGSTGSTEESKDSSAPPVPKAKPAVPVRPVGSKIAALKAGFLTDLNSRLQLGPQAPKPQEKKEEDEAPAEKAPLSDARKGRARGPARRKPALASSTETRLPSIPEIRITETWDVWQMGEDGSLVVGEKDKTEKAEPAAPDASESADTTMAPPIAKNMAGEPADPAVSETKETPEADKREVNETTESSAVPVFTGVSEPVEPDVSSTVGRSHAPASSAEVATESQPAVEPSIQRDEPEAASAAVASGSHVEAQSSSDSVDEEDLENMTATADGKHSSDGDIHLA